MDFVGLDIGSITTKIVKLRKIGRRKFRLEGGTMFETPGGGMQADAESVWISVAESIKKGMSEAKISSKYAALSIHESEIFTRIVSMPKMSDSELQSAITWEAEQNIPLPLSEVNFSYMVVDTKDDESKEVMIIAAPKKLVDKYERVISLAGLTPVALETSLLAAGRALIPESDNNQIAPILLIIIGGKATEIGIVKNDNLVFTRSISSAGEALTRSLITSLQLDVTQAEAYKRRYGLAVDQLEGKVAQGLQPVVDVLIREAKRTVNFYESKDSKHKVQTAILTGGSAALPDLATLLAKSLNMEVQIGNPLFKVEVNAKQIQLPPETLPSYAVALGLGMKEI